MPDCSPDNPTPHKDTSYNSLVLLEGMLGQINHHTESLKDCSRLPLTLWLFFCFLLDTYRFEDCSGWVVGPCRLHPVISYSKTIFCTEEIVSD